MTGVWWKSRQSTFASFWPCSTLTYKTAVDLSLLLCDLLCLSHKSHVSCKHDVNIEQKEPTSFQDRIPSKSKLFTFTVHFSSGTFCSHVPPADLVSNGDKLHISFSSNDKVVDTGFKATWRAVDPTEGKTGEKWSWQDTEGIAFKEIWCISLFLLFGSPVTHTHTHTVPCGGSFSSEQGEITSPKWPADYPAQSVCTWHISIPAAETVHVAFTHFELQAINVLGDCVDYVEFFNQNMTSLGRLLFFKVSCVYFVFVSMFSFISGEKTIWCCLFFSGRFCGFGLPPVLSITGDTAIIRFMTNWDNQQSGFWGYWTTDLTVFPTLPAPPPNPWDNITICKCSQSHSCPVSHAGFHFQNEASSDCINCSGIWNWIPWCQIFKF